MLNFLDEQQLLLWEREKLKTTTLITSHQNADYSSAFIATVGSNRDGRDNIESVIDQGCTFIIAEDAGPSRNTLYEKKYHWVKFLWIKDLPKKVSYIAADFYKNFDQNRNLHNAKVIAVTGTNGKTSVSNYIAAIISKLLIQDVGIIGTLGNGVYPYFTKSLNTTPSAEQIQSIIHDFTKNSYLSHIVLEASSHGIEQSRIKAIDFEQAIFTNLTHDHLDYHGNIEEYYQAKKKLFTEHIVSKAIINIDDPYGKRLYQELQDLYYKQNIFAVSKNRELIEELKCEYYTIIENEHFDQNGITADFVFVLNKRITRTTLKTSMLGMFNLDNLGMAFTSLVLLNINPILATLLMSEIKAPRGRMQLVPTPVDDIPRPKVVIDFAHTPAALELAIKSLKAHGFKKIFTVFGCGGDRDKTKRPIMGKIAYENSDKVVITSDNPRNENPLEISKEVVAGIANPQQDRVIIQNNREQAIKAAIAVADANTLVLIAGKGHETEQIVGNSSYYFNDYETVKNIWNKDDQI